LQEAEKRDKTQAKLPTEEQGLPLATGYFQAKGGNIVKIGDSLTTVQTATGSKIGQASKNLILILEDEWNQ
jgi:hypothetical protein